ncbi:MAG: hypothetical protein AB8B51_21540 [Sedimentitalea sp.]
MIGLATMGHVIRTQQDADFSVELGFTASSGATGPPGDTIRRQRPPQIVTLTFFGRSVPMDRHLPNSERCAFVDHPIVDLLRHPTVFDAFNPPVAQLRMFDQLARPGKTIRVHQVRSGTVANRHDFFTGAQARQRLSNDNASKHAISSTETFACLQRSILRRSVILSSM